MNRNYCERCYIAFYWTLAHIFELSKHPVAPHPFSLCDLLSNMCPFTFATGMSADPAVYCEYEEILKRIISGGEDETPVSGYRAGREFLQMYMDEFDYELEETLQAFGLDEYAFAYERSDVKEVQ